jgi:hypothetical protein
MTCSVLTNTGISTHAAEGLPENKKSTTSGSHLPETERKAILTLQIIKIYFTAQFVTPGLMHAGT